MTSLAPWRSPLARALHRNRSLVYARYVQLATVRQDGRPANRTVVFRGFWADTNQLRFVTDNRSEKVAEIARSPWAEVCWYFPNTREQFRLAGQLRLIDHTETDTELQKARQQIWQELSDAARSQFAWADPGLPRVDTATFEVEPPDAQTPFVNFDLLLFAPYRVDHLELRGNPQNRFIYSFVENNWSQTEVNP